MKSKTFLIFGASGTIGKACGDKLSGNGTIIFASKEKELLTEQLANIDFLDGVIWAQGLNLNDSVFDFQAENYERIFQANLGFILQTAQILVGKKKISQGSNLVMISSIWSEISRPNKLTYSVSKAAVSAAVRSMAIDLGSTGIQVNAIAPGPIASAMTQSNLTAEQIAIIATQTPLKRLVSLEEVANVATKFANGEMSGVTGQEIVIDGGWGVSKLV